MKSIATFLRMIKIEHSLFALPFAFTSMFIAANGLPSLHVFLWVVVAMVSARSAAMAINRLLDAEIDARNPRTEDRDIPQGRITKKQTLLYIIASFAIFFMAAFMLNPLALMLSPIPVLIFLIYSYAKRFTNLCHVVLGFALGFATIGAWVAVRADITIVPVILCLAVLAWVAGFDILYAIQDIEFDREEGLHSIPAVVGVSGSLIIARIFHIIAFCLFISLKFAADLGMIYLAGIILSGAFMVYENTLVSKDDLSKLNIAFFNTNAYISITICVFTFLDIMV